MEAVAVGKSTFRLDDDLSLGDDSLLVRRRRRRRRRSKLLHTPFISPTVVPAAAAAAAAVATRHSLTHSRLRAWCVWVCGCVY